ncbi:MAG: hypothetical protein K8T26_05015 [Lentisphaerae bacterium]|nr:hypothetical protein [Lentisphaerota bacterium]
MNWRNVGLLAGYWIFAVAGSVCFKQGGTDEGHRLAYFLGGNALGISATWFMMRLYSHLNVNVAMILCQSGAFMVTQGLYWVLYRAHLAPLQWGGIAVVMVGTALATWQARPVAPAPQPAAEGAAS